jgi:hypothetical protein
VVASALDDGGEPVNGFGTAGEDIRMGGTGTVVLDRPDTGERVDDGSGTDLADWFCLKVKPFVCVGCNRRVSHYDDAEHRVVVWPSEDDPNMLRIVDELDDADEPEVVEYERALGRAVSYYELTPS